MKTKHVNVKAPNKPRKFQEIQSHFVLHICGIPARNLASLMMILKMCVSLRRYLGSKMDMFIDCSTCLVLKDR